MKKHTDENIAATHFGVDDLLLRVPRVQESAAADFAGSPLGTLIVLVLFTLSLVSTIHAQTIPEN